MKRVIMVTLFLGNSGVDLEAAQRGGSLPGCLKVGQIDRVSSHLLPQENLTMRKDFEKFSLADRHADDEHYKDRYWADPENTRPWCWLARASVEEEGAALSLTFSPPFQQPCRYTIRLNRGRFLTDHGTHQPQGFTVDMTKLAFLWGERALKALRDRETQKISRDKFLSREEKKAALAQKGQINLHIDRNLRETGRQVARLYGTSFVTDASGRFVFFICRVHREGDSEPITLQAELGNIDDIDEWMVVDTRQSRIGIADKYIQSISMEYL